MRELEQTCSLFIGADITIGLFSFLASELWLVIPLNAFNFCLKFAIFLVYISDELEAVGKGGSFGSYDIVPFGLYDRDLLFLGVPRKCRLSDGSSCAIISASMKGPKSILARDSFKFLLRPCSI